MKTCSAPGCTRPVFSHGFCKYDQYRRKMKGGDLYQAKKPTKSLDKSTAEPRSQSGRPKIPRRSQKRQNEEKYYAEQAKDFFNEAVINGTNICIFCGERVKKFEGLHHWVGRFGQYLLDKTFWSVVHNDCHLQYHRSTVKQMTEAWGRAFWDRLQRFNYSLWEKIKNRDQKSAKLNPTLFDEEED